ncbi:MAG: aldehyde dehydrogenase EutE [bacterium]|jgi:propionaldehyde dehydrogenase|nr:aldehyde dehydrogenase EutE [bacterium]
MDERSIAEIVRRVIQEVQTVEANASGHVATCAGGAVPGGRDGVFTQIEDAIQAAYVAYQQYTTYSMDDRKRFIAAIRETSRKLNQQWAELAVQDTGMGRVDHKIAKNALAIELTPGTEELTTTCVTGANGLMMQEYTPFGVIGSITPCTNPTAMVINHSICMLSAGNAVVFAPHPKAIQCTLRCMQDINRALVAAGAPANLLTSVSEPTMESAQAIMAHPKVNVLVATGGPGLVKAALTSPKRVVVAGPGNPPVIVDDTADLSNAAKSIYDGSSFDNNMPCICEKECFVLSSVYDAFLAEIQRCGAYLLNPSQTQTLVQATIVNNQVNRDYVGQSAAVLGRVAGVTVPSTCDLLIAETDKNHPFVDHEMLMPILPIVRVNTFEEAMQAAKEAEHGFRHTAIIHSQRLDRITQFAKLMQTNIFVANGPCGTALGNGGEGWTAFTIAGQSGEGPCTPKSFSRLRRFSIKGALRII